MKIFKIVLILLGLLIATPLIIALFVPKTIEVSREVIIAKNRSEIFQYVKQLKNQIEYSKWQKMDPDQKVSFNGTDGTVGFVYAWDSQKEDVGAGEQEIKAIVENERIDYELRFKRPFESTAGAYMTFESASPGETKVLWGFKGDTKYPFNLMHLFIDMDKMLGDDLNVGLQNLKQIMETPKIAGNDSVNVSM
jgi:hypothetical protein